MTFDNGKTIIMLKLRALVYTVLFFLYLLVALFAKVIHFPVAGLSKNTLTLIIVGIYIILSFYPLLLKYRYIYFSNAGEAIIIRFYSVGIFTAAKHSVEISKQSYAGFEKGRTLLGLVKFVILKQKIREGVAKYPPVYITSLTRSEREKLFSGLET